MSIPSLCFRSLLAAGILRPPQNSSTWRHQNEKKTSQQNGAVLICIIIQSIYWDLLKTLWRFKLLVSFSSPAQDKSPFETYWIGWGSRKRSSPSHLLFIKLAKNFFGGRTTLLESAITPGLNKPKLVPRKTGNLTPYLIWLFQSKNWLSSQRRTNSNLQPCHQLRKSPLVCKRI